MQGAPNDKVMKRSLADQARICTEKVSVLTRLLAVQQD